METYTKQIIRHVCLELSPIKLTVVRSENAGENLIGQPPLTLDETAPPTAPTTKITLKAS